MVDELLDIWYSPEQIYQNLELLNEDKIRVRGDLDLSLDHLLKLIPKLPLHLEVTGSLDLSDQIRITNLMEIVLSVGEDLNLSYMELTKIPKILNHTINGHFDIHGNRLINFQGCPRKIIGTMSIDLHKIKDFKDFPIYVGKIIPAIVSNYSKF